MKFKFLVASLFLFLPFVFSLTIVLADWETKEVNLYEVNSNFQTGIQYYFVIDSITEAYMGNESHRPTITISIQVDESIGDYWLYLEWEFILIRATEIVFLNGEGDPLEWRFDFYDTASAEFVIEQADDYIIIFIEEGIETGYWFTAEVSVDLCYYIWEEPTTTSQESTITTTTQTTTSQADIPSKTTTITHESETSRTTSFNPVLVPLAVICICMIARRRIRLKNK